MNNQIAIVVSNDNTGVNALETIQAIKNAGFENVFVQWYDKDFSVSQLEQVKYCQQLGLNVVFAHLGYQQINNIWLDDKKYDEFVVRYQQNILDLHNLGINLVIMHLSSKFDAPTASEAGLRRFQAIVDYAEELGVQIAFENTKLLGYLDYIFTHIKNKNIGLCFDVGHYHCNNKDNWDISGFNHKVLAVHLHDNDGSADQHLLPFDGTINWPKALQKLENVNYEGPITLEVVYRKEYTQMNINDFYKLAYKRALALSNLK